MTFTEFLASDTVLLYVLVLLAAVLALAAIRTPDRHTQNIRAAKKAYARLQALDDADVLAFARRLDPFVFEELILVAFRKKGYRTFRNGKYSHDGGVDGKVRKGLRTYLIQDKRYAGYISPDQLLAFEYICHRRHVRGFFIHTGKTGIRSREIVEQCPHISIISGKALVDLLRGR